MFYMKYFFWIAFAVFLAASIPHVAYFFASFEPSSGPEGVWWWVVSYAIAISIDVTIYLLSYTAFQRYRKYRSVKAVWQYWLLIVICTVFSWIINWAYAKQFHSVTMLSAAEQTAPWLIQVFPFMASSFPLLGIVYTMMAENIAEVASETKAEVSQQLLASGESEKQSQFPLAAVHKALTTRTLNLSNKEVAAPPRNTEDLAPAKNVSQGDQNAITGQFVAVDEDTDNGVLEEAKTSNHTSPTTETNPDKLHMTIEALKLNMHITDEELAQHLSLKRPASARFWRLKAVEILNTNETNSEAVNTPIRDIWATTEALASEMGTKR
jgi:hypothetical protein